MARSATPPRPARAEVRPGVWLDSRLGVYFETPGALVVADLHWGYATSHRATGNLLPVWGDGEIGARLNALLADYAPREMIWLGDSLHTLAGRAEAEAFLKTCATPVTILPGNHDRRWAATLATEAGASGAMDEGIVVRGGYLFHHGDRIATPAAGQVEVIGHHHPAFSHNDGAGGRVRVPALVAGPRRLILPAFSPWAAGGRWNEKLAPEEILWAIAPSRVFAVRPLAAPAPTQ